MMNFLHIAVAQYHLLVNTTHIREVVELDQDDDNPLHGCRMWRGTSIATLDLRLMLGVMAPLPPNGSLVYEENESDVPILLLCDRVFGLVRAEEADFKIVSRSLGRIAHFIDAVLPDSSSRKLFFRLKQGIPFEQ
jgi:chemotaxis signal transduction protein